MISPIFYNINLFNQYKNFTSHSQNEIKNGNEIVCRNSLDKTKADFPWVKNPIIISALDELTHVVFSTEEEAYLKNLGLEIPFSSGQEAVDFIKKSNLRIDFADTGSDGIYAQYDYGENKIFLNKKYKNTSDTADILALAEAILHESGHAKDNDGDSSIQEELNNLGMGALAHKFFERKYPQIFDSSNTLIVNDGVNVYSALFFDNDPQKKALIQRVQSKYISLPEGDKKHSPSSLAHVIKNNFS